MRYRHRAGSAWWWVAGALWLAGCAGTHYPVNPPLAQVDIDHGYRIQRVYDADPDDRIFMHVAFSGGGKRAAAFGFGVLEALRDTPMRWEGREGRLLDQVDLMMGVSGGSILAAAYALDGAAGMERFEREFVQADLEGDLVARLASPRNLWRLGSPRFGRSDVLAELLDERLYRGATFADLSRALRKPFTIVYASDMSTGARFEFVQDQFDYLCSDLDGVPLARAVAASSAVPLLLSPVTVWNHAPAADEPGCGEPLMVSTARRFNVDPEVVPRLAALAGLRERRDDGLARPYVHLLDGGLSDNVNARGPLDYIGQFGGVVRGSRYAGYRGIRRSVFIIVNAETSVRSPQDRSADVPGPLRATLALADIPINRNSATALGAMRATIAAWEAEVREAHARGDYAVFAADARFYLIEVNLGATADAALRERLLAVPTSLTLPREDTDLLRAHARAALAASPDFQRLLREME
jgi:NTE family protein